MLFFENGFYTQPRYFASIPGIPSVSPDTTLGFNDPDGVYPDKIGESDFNRLARGVSTDTLVTTRNAAREIDIDKADGTTWDEPSSAYNATYPHNLVISTHGGSVIEIDSTPDNERLNIYHPSNTFMEIDKDGNVVIKNKKSKYEIVLEDKNIYVKKDMNETTDVDKTEFVGVNKTVDIGGNKEENIGGDLTINVTGDVTITSPTTSITGGTVSLASQGTLKKLVNETMISLYNAHTHNENGDGGGVTDPPNTSLSTGSNATVNTTAS